MIRQRIHTRTPALALIVRLLTIALAAAMIYGGAMLILLAVKVSPHSVNSISGYRTIFDRAASLTHSQFTTRVSLIAGFVGLVVFLVFGYLATQELPRPYLTRTDVALANADSRGHTVANPRAIERLAEIAACRHSDVASAVGRLTDDEINLGISVNRAQPVAETLTDVQQRVLDAISQHDLPRFTINVTATSFDPQTTRELS